MTSPDGLPGLRDLRPIAVPAYAPTFLSAIGTGAILPIVPLTAHDLGAGVGMAAAVASLIGIGQLVGDLPAGMLAGRFGERKALLVAAAVELLGSLACMLSGNLVSLMLAVLTIGIATSVFNLARHSFLIALVPSQLRGRAMSTLGGVNRIGLFLGPMLGAVVLSFAELWAVYAVNICAALAVIAVVVFADEIAEDEGESLPHRPSVSVFSSAIRYRKVLATLGLGALCLAAARGTRTVILPVWAASLGLNATQVSIIVAASAAVDMLLFYPGGYVMDRYGRTAVAVPSMVVLGLGLLALPLASSNWQLLLIACVLGFGNGVGAGVGATLSADSAPPQDRAAFLASWRLMIDSGTALGPALFSLVAGAIALSAGAMALGVVTSAGAFWLWCWIPRINPIDRARRRSHAARKRGNKVTGRDANA